MSTPTPFIDHYISPPAAAIGVTVVYFTACLVVLPWYWRQRQLQPLKARGVFLTAVSTLGGSYFFLELCVNQGNPSWTGVCVLQQLNVVSSAIFLPFWAIPLMMRGALLVLTMNQNRGKLSGKTDSWIYTYRNYYEHPVPQLAVIVLAAAVQIALLYGLTYNGVVPGDFGPCRISVHPYIQGAISVVYVLVLVFIFYYAYPLEDVYSIKQELTSQLVLSIVILVLWVLAGVSVIKVQSSIFLFILIGLSGINLIVVPLVLTYRDYYKHFHVGVYLPSKLESGDDHEALEDHSSVGTQDGVADEHKPSKPKTIAAHRSGQLDDTRLISYLRDPEYLSEFKRFCVRAFCAETITFFIEMQRRDEIARMEPGQRAAECQRLYDNFIALGGPLELNLTDVVRHQVTVAHTERPDDVGAFDVVMRETYWLMKTSLFPAWKQDASFLKLKQKNAAAAGALSTAAMELLERPSIEVLAA